MLLLAGLTLLWCRAELPFPGTSVIIPIVCGLQQSSFIHVVIPPGEGPLEHLHDGPLLWVLGGE